MFEPLLYYSTNLKAEPVPFKEALLKGLAPDGGLYMPVKIPVCTLDQIGEFSDMEYYEIAFHISKLFLSGQIENFELLNLVKDAYNYTVPLEHVYQRKYIMRLDQGPTASFKDFAARMMGRLLHYYMKREKTLNFPK